MCGINGLVSTSDSDDITQILNRMNGEIFHRGPDQDGLIVKNTNEYTVGMGMRRLSIIDLSTGKQPIYSDDQKISIVFNGEIYNYLKLKQDLKSKGISFKTTSDTEVILRLYEVHGTAAFSMLDGMFAFSIYDGNLKKLFIARDFFGEKPLYYTTDDKGFMWASELKSIIKQKKVKPRISKEGLNLYFQLTYIPAPFTIYEGIFKLKANHYLEFDCTDQKYLEKEIGQNFNKEKSDLSFEQATEKTHTLVQESVLSRSVADVPLGTFLSGGVDSSIVSLCLAQQSDAKIDTFSIGFEKKSFDETDKSRTVAKLINSNHHEFIVSEGDLKDNMDHILLNFDEPFADSSSLATYLVANKTRQHVKVALTGDGGDEVFGGYNKYYMGKLNRKYTAVIPKAVHSTAEKFASSMLSTGDDNRGLRFKMKRLLKAVNYDGNFYFNIISLGFQDEELREILQQDNYEKDSLKYYKDKVGDKNKSLSDFRNIDRLLSLEGDMLVKVDRTSMLTSLESRAPFLNKKIWNFTSSIPEHYLMKGWNKKYLLKESFKQYFPEDFLNKSKQGFGVPVGDWLRGYLKPELMSYIEKGFLLKQGIFHKEEISHLVNKHIEGKEDNTFRVWTFFCFQKWYKETYLRN
ncbi:asparagine synthase (glutamine-hydrolysing) [Salinimicrobium sediminis]|uniref:asparagine synthase (glutamine-hydrolyzing) n=1 Tax=Salinimicrobium sediminis TaxID=1343891 RepID=A0A285X4W6_9FLAO|nr:asparagine synthase (glutamine-hydrolyzing) [Salinimicrobium sediminis]SOC80318.1 asparagine synthase (glutamine-hydrolysing) [Salinimicrobium sediminis]